MDKREFLTKPRIEPIKLRENMTVKELVENYARSGVFNAGHLSEACRIYERMLQENATVCLTLSGAMTPTGMGGMIITMVERGLIDFIISTGANLYHDLHFALDLPVHQGDPHVDDRVLYRAGIERIYDVFITDDLLRATDTFIQSILRDRKFDAPISTAELHHIIGEAVLARARYPEKSLLAQAAKYNVPVYCPSPGDSSIGMNTAVTKLLGSSLTVDPDLDVLETTAIVLNSELNGVIEVGGGASKNFYMQTQPMLWQILNVNKGGHDYFVQVTTDAPHWGGLSGATPQEAISWGKVNPNEVRNHVVVYCDATIAVPIIFSYALDTVGRRRLRQLYLRRGEFLDALRKVCGSVEETSGH
ncbi:MAG: deoxyhypusine synthase [Candidatus Bathyarchaeia archaeon]